MGPMRISARLWSDELERVSQRFVCGDGLAELIRTESRRPGKQKRAANF